MHYFFVDTCIWLNLAKTRNVEYIISTIEHLIEVDGLRLVVPQLVKDEFIRNKDRVIDSARQRLSQEFKQIKNVVKEFGADHKAETLAELNEISSRLPILSEVTGRMAERLIGIMDNSELCEITGSEKNNAVQRALDKKAPFHRSKNSIADALLIESFSSFKLKIQSDEGEPGENVFHFITDNHNDFSDTDKRKPHSDFDAIFDRYSFYHLDIVNAIKHIDETLLSEIEFELDWITDETRSLTEILDYITEFDKKIWYNRHKHAMHRIEIGEIQVVPRGSKEFGNDVFHEDVLERAKEAAKKVEEIYTDIIPEDDFEWGMINGKLSALRWVLGDEWDMLDT